ncbi:50S ribosomal protein L11 methyltransferase [Cecembia calidifontis]|jgi:ribosomal protein L11 methyltransferase|uniref:Ribosomal protein L11 methyltransferase n=1 Tax=Cecembia calidifontis TaxID=1187080 RepID=A0A4Q7P7X5_9BACT|nr:50S ribosomal protein L11 methyltransferase [Cecembia calidifontis]RZS95638.1 [LSU ribosomal protein L11P]-lysine N-methyltransferase [Cecembia calidifontis]
MQYLEFKISCSEPYREILIAELSEIGFDSFLETDEGLDAYIQEDVFQRNTFLEIIEQYKEAGRISVQEGILPKVNWNEEWEKNYDPITVGDQVYVRASFHPSKPEFPHEILINPKMSFGTGHHATTYLMISHQLNLDHQDKRVLDIGAGTGILAVMAHKLGAAHIEAFDIDEWCVENGNENFDLNGMATVRMGKGTVREVKPQGPFDIVLANINKNVLLDEMEVYSSLVKEKGYLLLSGFYEHDIADIEKRANEFGLVLKDKKIKDNWAALAMQKI